MKPLQLSMPLSLVQVLGLCEHRRCFARRAKGGKHCDPHRRLLRLAERLASEQRPPAPTAGEQLVFAFWLAAPKARSAPPAPAQRTTATCAMCGARPAQTMDEVDGRRILVCYPCRDGEIPEPPPPPTTGERLLRVLRRSDGMSIVELAQALGEDDEQGRAKLCAALIRLNRAGRAYYTGGGNDRTYYAGEKPLAQQRQGSGYSAAARAQR